MTDRSKWTVKDYQRELAARGAKVSGRKKELVERLEDYERNHNFGFQPIIIEGDPLPHFPDISKFRTITASDQDVFPKITKSHVETYVLYRQDNLGTLKIKAVERGEKMEEKSILALSYFRDSSTTSAINVNPNVDSSSTAPTDSPSPTIASLSTASPSTASPSTASPSTASSSSTDSDENDESIVLYISGIVEAEMQNLTYCLKLAIDATMGEVLQAHCECPAGRGPTSTCKHVVSVLLSLTKFALEGVLEVQQSCTDVLQSFKKPRKPHKGAPVTTDNLGKGPKYDWDHDPRPEKYRKWAKEQGPSHIYNLTNNFVYQSGRSDIADEIMHGAADNTLLSGHAE